jgi:hypothetical protein
LPQPFTLLARRGPPEHLAPDPAGQLDDRLRVAWRFSHQAGSAAPQPFMAIETRLGPSS